MTVVQALLLLAVFTALVNWFAVARARKPLEYVAKPATLVFLVTAAVALEPADPTQQRWFVAALVLSLAGDVFLMLPRNGFIPGLGSFLMAHVAYIAGFWVRGVDGEVFLAAGVAAFAVAAAVGWPVVRALRASPRRGLVIPVIGYAAVISVMVASAVGTRLLLAAVGAALFYLSDGLIAWNRFVAPMRWAPVAIMVTYHLGQFGLVLSLR